jgi:hypothetical protein
MNHNPAVARLLREQFGVVTRAQVLAEGIPSRTLTRECAVNVYETLLPGVLRSTAHPASFESRAMAVQLHAGDRAALSGPTAARLHGMRQMFAAHIWFRTVDRARTRLPTWVTRTESPWLFDGEGAIRQLGCWRLLAPAPLLVTLAEQFNDHRFERAAEDAWHLRLISPVEAADFLDAHRGRGRHGVTRFERWLERTLARPRPSQSTFELDVLDAIRRAGLPEPARQYPLMLLNGDVVHLDLAWPDATLAVEPGHTWWHGGDLHTTRDYARDRACGLVGWHVMRYSEAARADLPGVGREVLAMYKLRLAR